jgi:hypothetical protein
LGKIACLLGNVDELGDQWLLKCGCFCVIAQAFVAFWFFVCLFTSCAPGLDMLSLSGHLSFPLLPGFVIGIGRGALFVACSRFGGGVICGDELFESVMFLFLEGD